jgi:hypothetical protein
MKTQMHRKAIAIAAVVVVGLSITGGAALARIGSFSGGHIGGGFHGGPYMGDTISTPSPISIPPVDTLCRRRPRPRSRRQVLDQYSTNRPSRTGERPG